MGSKAILGKHLKKVQAFANKIILDSFCKHGRYGITGSYS
jgi:hypothetical protein